jgi:hypothetical protein
MNTPRSKPIIRANSAPGRKPIPIDATYHSGIKSETFQCLLGRFVSDWTLLEEQVIDVLAYLLEGHSSDDAHLIFRSILNSRDRIAVMRNLLEQSTMNVKKSADYDSVIAEFESLNTTRNEYVHGKWWTNMKTGGMYLESPTPTYVPSFFARREVTENEFKNNLRRLEQLGDKIAFELEWDDPSPGTQAPPAGDTPNGD